MFGTVFTHLEEGWQKRHIHPFGNLSTHPGCSFLHYAAQVCARHLEFHLCAYTPHVYPDTETGAWHCHDKCSHLLDRQTITLLYLFGSLMLFVNMMLSSILEWFLIFRYFILFIYFLINSAVIKRRDHHLRFTEKWLHLSKKRFCLSLYLSIIIL